MSATNQPPTDTHDRPQPTRTEEKDVLLKEALARPGVREALRVYNDWQQQEQALAPYREVMREYPVVITTNHTNFDSSHL